MKSAITLKLNLAIGERTRMLNFLKYHALVPLLLIYGLQTGKHIQHTSLKLKFA